MNMLIEELQILAADWRAWVVVAVMGIVAVFSVFQAVRCPLLMGTSNPNEKDVADAKIIQTNIGPRFALLMLAGFCLTLSGLYMIAYGIKPALALAALVIGIVIIQTEPARLRIREGRRMVLASSDGSSDSQTTARTRLRGSYRELAAVNVGILVCLIGGMLAF